MIGSLSKKAVALVAVVAASALLAGLAEAGVIVHEQEIVTQKEHHSPSIARVVEIEGPKEKISDKIGVHDIEVDLANKQTLIIHPGSKDYFVLPFPPKAGSTAQWMVLPLITPPLLNYKGTRKSSAALGYSCQEFSGDGEFNGSRYSVQACYSTAAPGADTYSAFVKRAAAQLGSLAPAGVDIPSGVPLWMRITQEALKAPPAFAISKKDTKKNTAPTPVPGGGDWVEVETRNITVTSILATKEPIPDGEFVPQGFRAKRPTNLGF